MVVVELDYLPDAVGHFRHPGIEGGRSMNIVGMVPNEADHTLTLGLTDPSPSGQIRPEENAGNSEPNGRRDAADPD